MALVVVIWVATLLTVVLSAFAFSMRTEVEGARNFKEEAEMAALAEAGVARAMAEVVNADRKGPEAAAAVARYSSGEVALGRGSFEVTIQDEERKVHLNRAGPDVLVRLIRQTGVDQRAAEAIADGILDWRDPDNLHRLQGAEADYYRGLPTPYRARNADFETLEELLLVKGVTPEIFAGTATPERLSELLARRPDERDFQAGEYLGIARFLTILGSGRVNLNTAGSDVMIAMGVSPAEAESLQRAREGGLVLREQPAAARGAQFALASTTYAIESIGRVPGSPATYRIRAIVRSEGTPAQPRASIVAWKAGV
jgi:type II secretory pathway component PulK